MPTIILTRAEIAESGGDGGGDGPRGTITTQACSPIRRTESVCARRSPGPTGDRFSCSTFSLPPAVVSVAVDDRAAFIAARMTGAGEQPGRERPHLRTADPDPRVGSGVAHAPPAGA